VATILVLEDDEDSLLVLEASLEMCGYSVRGARSCAEAEALLDEGGVDALVSDYCLDDGNAVDWLKGLGGRKPRVALLVTGYSDPEARDASRTAGFDAHLVKPVLPSDLERKLREALESASAAPSPR
jgi:CheY-like chemotaxis protein